MAIGIFDSGMGGLTVLDRVLPKCRTRLFITLIAPRHMGCVTQMKSLSYNYRRVAPMGRGLGSSDIGL